MPKELYIKPSDVTRTADRFGQTKTPCGADAKQTYNAPTHQKTPVGGGK